MLKKQTEAGKPSIRGTAMRIMAVAVPVMLISVAVSLALILLVQKQSAQQLQDVVDIHAELIDSQMSSLRYYMSWSIFQDENILELVKYKDIGKVMEAAQDIHERFGVLQQNYSQDYQFFLYSVKSGLYMNCGKLKMNYRAFRNLKAEVIDYIGNHMRGLNTFSRYITFRVEQGDYITTIAPYHDSFLICMIAANDIIKPLLQVNMGRQGYVYLTGEDGRVLAAGGPAPQMQAPGGFMEMSYQMPLFDRQYTIHVVADKFGTFETAMAVQLMIALMSLLIIAVMLIMIYYLRLRVLKPIRRFSENLAIIVQDGGVEMQDTKILELEQANKVFHDLLQQIRKLKIDIYEREQERQRIQLEYMQLQIKPHFYLNCLSSIHSMAQLQMYDAISSMAQSTSQYLRYIFKNSQEWVQLKNEADHVRNYLDINVMRCGESLTYAIYLDEKAEEAPIPPLVLQPFVENIIKHAVTLDDPIHISISAVYLPEGEGQVSIRISDNGKGFPEEQLAILQSGRVLEQKNGRHIGIRNTVQRLRLMYGTKVSIRFYNHPDTGGACIAVEIPFKPPDTGESRGSLMA